jgi:hypothetical protein
MPKYYGHGMLCKCVVCGLRLNVSTTKRISSCGTLLDKIDIIDRRVDNGVPFCFDHNVDDLNIDDEVKRGSGIDSFVPDGFWTLLWA